MTLYILSCELSGTEGNKKCTYTNSYSQTYTQTIEDGLPSTEGQQQKHKLKQNKWTKCETKILTISFQNCQLNRVNLRLKMYHE